MKEPQLAGLFARSITDTNKKLPLTYYKLPSYLASLQVFYVLTWLDRLL